MLGRGRWLKQIDVVVSAKVKKTTILATNRSKMDPTPALCALLLWTWRPVANKMPSFTVTERCEKEAMRSSFQPESGEKGRKK